MKVIVEQPEKIIVRLEITWVEKCLLIDYVKGYYLPDAEGRSLLDELARVLTEVK